MKNVSASENVHYRHLNLCPILTVRLAGLKQKLSPNKPQTSDVFAVKTSKL